MLFSKCKLLYKRHSECVIIADVKMLVYSVFTAISESWIPSDALFCFFPADVTVFYLFTGFKSGTEMSMSIICLWNHFCGDLS